MTSETLMLLAGVVFLFVAIVGGSFIDKEIKSRKILTWGKIRDYRSGSDLYRRVHLGNLQAPAWPCQ